MMLLRDSWTAMSVASWNASRVVNGEVCMRLTGRSTGSEKVASAVWVSVVMVFVSEG